MGASFLAELFKLRKRPATWVLALIWVAVVALLGYLLVYSFVANAPPPPDDAPAGIRQQQEDINEAQLRAMYPENLLRNVIAGTPLGFGSAMILVLGAMAAGSEYGWGTVKTSLTQRPGRLGVLLGKLLALALVLLAFVVVGLAAGAVSSLVVAQLEGAPVSWPPVEDFLRGVGVGLLVFAVYGSLGFALATLFRGTALAIGLGLAWVLVIETAISGLPIDNDAFENFRKATIGENVLAVTNTLGSPFPEAFGIPDPLVENPTQAVLVLLAYTVLFLLLSALAFRRDVT
jgi:ABC-type transport system involved in multi-copper enzyme maturation permease subunit